MFSFKRGVDALQSETTFCVLQRVVHTRFIEAKAFHHSEEEISPVLLVSCRGATLGFATRAAGWVTDAVQGKVSTFKKKSNM